MEGFHLGILKCSQHAVKPMVVEEEDCNALRMLVFMVGKTPSRSIKLMAPSRPKLVVYSDASWEGKARFGWI